MFNLIGCSIWNINSLSINSFRLTCWNIGYISYGCSNYLLIRTIPYHLKICIGAKFVSLIAYFKMNSTVGCS